MPVVKTHCNKNPENIVSLANKAEEKRMQEIVSHISDELLRSKPQLVAEVRPG